MATFHSLVSFILLGCVVMIATSKPVAYVIGSQITDSETSLSTHLPPGSNFPVDEIGSQITDSETVLSTHLSPGSNFPVDEITPEEKRELLNNLTCSDVQRVQKLHPRISIELLVDFVLELLETESYDPSKEVILTQDCPADQGVFNNITVFLLKQSILFNFVALFIVLTVSVLVEFCCRIYNRKSYSFHADLESGIEDDEKEMKSKDQGKWSWISKKINSIWGDMQPHLNGHHETDELVLLSFQLCIIAILIPSFLMVITVLLIGVYTTWNVIRTGLCLWVVFVYSVVVFYFHGSRNKMTIAGESQTSKRTLLISRIHRDDCTESFLRSYFQDNDGDVVAGVNLIHKLDEPSNSLPATAAFVTFKTRQHAEFVINQPKNNTKSWAVEWAPNSADIVWAFMHQKGSIICLLIKIIQYFFIVLLPLAGSTIAVELLKLLVEHESKSYYVLIYSKSILTLTFLMIVRISPVFQVNHLRKSSKHMGVFLTSLIIIVVSEIVLPMLNFNDIWNSIVWTQTDPNVVNHWIRLQCIFRPDLGSEMAMGVIEWTLFQSCFILPRVKRWATQKWLRLIKSPNAEDDIPREEFDMGERYSQLVAQFVMTCVGYFTYPPIIPIAILCLALGYVIDRYTMAQTFKPTYSGANIHRLAILLVLIMLVIQSALLFFKNVLMVEAEASLIGDSALTALCVGLTSLLCIVSIAVQFHVFWPQRPCDETIPAADESRDYIPPEPANLKRTRSTPETTRKPPTQRRSNKSETPKPSGLFGVMKFVLLTFAVPISVACILVTIIRFTYVPKVAYTKSAANVSLAFNANLRMYTGRVPFTIMKEVCQKESSWLTIESRCDDILLDNAVRNNRSAVFAKTNEHQRLLWTGGFFNLTTGDEWQWLDESAKTEYDHFCEPNETEAIIAKARERSVTMLYIVKDYRGDKFSQNGLACWQIYSQDQLTDMGFSFPADKTPRLPFACREWIPVD